MSDVENRARIIAKHIFTVFDQIAMPDKPPEWFEQRAKNMEKIRELFSDGIFISALSDALTASASMEADIVTVSDIALTGKVATAMQYLNTNPDSDSERRAALETLWLAAIRFNEIVRDVLTADWSAPPTALEGEE